MPPEMNCPELGLLNVEQIRPVVDSFLVESTETRSLLRLHFQFIRLYISLFSFPTHSRETLTNVRGSLAQLHSTCSKLVFIRICYSFDIGGKLQDRTHSDLLQIL